MWAVVCGLVRGVICHRPPPFFDSCFSFFRGRPIFFGGGGCLIFVFGLVCVGKQEVVPRAGWVPRHGWQAALSARAALLWPCSFSSAGRGRRAWTQPAGRAWRALPRRVGRPRWMRKRGPCVRVRAVCGAGACYDLPFDSTSHRVYLARRNRVAGVDQTMAWVWCALWCWARWWEMGVFWVVRRLVGLHAWCKHAVGAAAGWMHGLWNVVMLGPSWCSCVVWRAWWCGWENA